jgi:lambda repressor-like predicted transcriptional regulator
MKLFIFLLGIAAGAAGYHYYHKPTCATLSPELEKSPKSVPPAADNRTLSEKARDGALAAKESISHKLVEWHLTPAEINRDLEQTGRVVRSKTAAAGRSLSNARLAAVIKGKYALEDDLSARAISVDADAGKVTLRGTVKSPELIARAISLALETDGVTSVDSELTVSAQ